MNQTEDNLKAFVEWESSLKKMLEEETYESIEQNIINSRGKE